MCSNRYNSNSECFLLTCCIVNGNEVKAEVKLWNDIRVNVGDVDADNEHVHTLFHYNEFLFKSNSEVWKKIKKVITVA